METLTPPPEHDNAGVVPLPPHVFLGAAALSLVFHLLKPFSLGGGTDGLILGMVFGAGGMALLITCWGLFKTRGTSIRPDHPATALIIAGPYRYSRNPIYVGLLLLYVALALLLAIGWFYVFLPGIVAYLRFFVIPREEAYLLRRFGEEYEAYTHRVGRWL